MPVEFGLCTLSDLPPEMCGCPEHRNSVGYTMHQDKDRTGVAIHHTLRASFAGRCALDKDHPIEIGDTVAKVMGRDGADMGTWCIACAETLT